MSEIQVSSGERGAATRWSRRVGDIEIGKYLLLVVELLLLVILIHVLHIEEILGFLRITPIIFVGFAVHAVIPRRFRLPFFLALSILAIGTTLGPGHAFRLVAMGLGLVGICHLPFSLFVRTALLVIAGSILAAFRAKWIEAAWADRVLPILGAMFMFRLIIYLYDLRHEKQSAPISQRLAYFFMLPNSCFPLFPVVDYQTFKRTYYDGEPSEIYQKGTTWMFRGLTHLVLFRVVYHYMVPGSADIIDLPTVFIYVVSAYLLYLHISGQFHLIVGILCLFGFNLPRTHHLYFFASSFNDFWRRVNIYWKDFLVKIFYYPAYMKLRRLGTTPAMIVATLIAFLATWLLHAYQWFWLQGSFPLRAVDGLFWGILALLVIANTLYEVRYGRRRRLSKPQWSLPGAALRSTQSVGVFLTICALWSMWSSESLSIWLTTVSVAKNGGPSAVLQLALVVAVAVALGVLVQFMAFRGWKLSRRAQRTFRRRAGLTAAASFILIILGQPDVHSLFGPDVAVSARRLTDNQLNNRDLEYEEWGYYEGLLGPRSFASSLWANRAVQPDDWRGRKGFTRMRRTDGLLYNELIPSLLGVHKGERYETNRWGMRDKHYEMDKPPRTYRIALLGASVEEGSGVRIEETYEAVAEALLNERNTSDPYDRYEILNFGVAGYVAVQTLAQFETKAKLFDPDAIIVVMHEDAVRRLSEKLAVIVSGGIPFDHEFLRRIVERSGVTSSMTTAAAARRFAPFGEEIIQWCLTRISESARERGIVPIWAYVPKANQARKGVDEVELRLWETLASEAGYLTFDLTPAYIGYVREQLQLAPWDGHPGVFAHGLLGEKLFELLVENQKALNLAFSPETAAAQ